MAVDQVITNNVGAIVMAGLFVWYMNRRDEKFQASLDRLTDALEKLARKNDKKG